MSTNDNAFPSANVAPDRTASPSAPPRACRPRDGVRSTAVKCACGSAPPYVLGTLAYDGEGVMNAAGYGGFRGRE